MCFRNYGLRKTSLEKCLKTPVPEHGLTVNMLKCAKHSWNLHGITFIIFTHHSEENTVRKCLS